MIRKYLILIYGLLLYCDAPAQLEVTAFWSQDTVEMGQICQLTLTIFKPVNTRILAVSRNVVDSVYSAYQTLQALGQDTSRSVVPLLADYDLLNYGGWQDPGEKFYFGPNDLSWDSSSSGRDELLQNSFDLRLWDPGENFIFLPAVLYDSGAGQEQHQEPGVVKVFVSPPAVVANTQSDSLSMAPIKPIIAEPSNITDFIGIFYGLAALAIAALGYWIFSLVSRKRNYREAVEEKPKEPAHVIALDALYKLRNEKLWQAGEIKNYQSRLTHIIREYIENRYSIPALEVTTDEIVKRVRNVVLSGNLINSMERVLRVADLVKFAKATPDLAIHEQFMEEALHFVRETKETEQKTEDATGGMTGTNKEIKAI